MTLDEAGYSDIIDMALTQEVIDAAYHGRDIRPAWIGAHRPRTKIEALQGIQKWASAHYDFYLSFVRDFMERYGNILDIGCGPGQATAMLARYSKAAAGMDSDETVIGFARKHNAVSGALFEYGVFPDMVEPHWRYDYVFCVETLEHIAYEKQVEFIDAALGMLLPDGRMFITTPNESSPSPPHIGVWSKEWVGHMTAHLGQRIVKRGYISNKTPEVGMIEAEASHHAWVLR